MNESNQNTKLYNKKTVLYVIEDTVATQFRYRVQNVLEALEKSEKWAGRYVLKRDLEGLELQDVALVVIGRQTAKDQKILNLIKKARRQKIKVLFDLDDLVFDYRDLKVFRDTVKEKNLVYWLGYFGGVRRIAKRADGFITTNDFLGKKIKRSFNKPYQVIPNSLNLEQIKVSQAAVEKKIKEKRAGFRIGYFSGSPTHEKDLAVAEPGLKKFLMSHDDVTFEVVGWMKFSSAMQELIKKERVRFTQPVDYLSLQKKIAEVDVNIAPLVINDFTNCKSELKFFEAGAVETTTIASPTYVFKQAIRDGENGMLAKSNEWYDKLEYLYQHPAENRKMARVAHKDALEKYAGKSFLQKVEEAYEHFSK